MPYHSLLSHSYMETQTHTLNLPCLSIQRMSYNPNTLEPLEKNSFRMAWNKKLNRLTGHKAQSNQSQHTLTVTWSYADETTFPVNPAAGLWAASMAATDTDLYVEAVDTETPETPLILKCQAKACSHRNNASSVNNNTIVVAWALAKAMHIIASTVR